MVETLTKEFRKAVLSGLASVALAMLIVGVCSSALVASEAVLASDAPSSPIRHVIVIVGENHSFDNLFGAYRPDSSSGQSVMNLRSIRC
jgi:phospholipase C